jgi:hypothetical protein
LPPQQHAALIDLNAMSKALFEALGPEGTLRAFMHYPANSFPNQTEAISDDTHFNGYGAYELARCVVHGIRQAKLPLRKYLDQRSFQTSIPQRPTRSTPSVCRRRRFRRRRPT